MPNKLLGIVLLFLIIIQQLDEYSCYFFKDERITNNGLAYPHDIKTLHGQNIMIRLMKTVKNQQKCLLKMPNWDLIDLTVNNDPRIKRWDSDCSVKIYNLQNSDQGRWQLQSMNGTKTLQGIFTVALQDPQVNNTGGDIVMSDSDSPETIDFGIDPKSAYCTVTQQHSTESHFFRGPCKLPVERVGKNLQGIWKLTVGMAGQVSEMEVEKYIHVYSEEIDVGFVKDASSNTITMYCNLKNSKRVLIFCRFERKQDKKGFNLNTGLGFDRYSYKGNGFQSKECGMTIEKPTLMDFGSWTCNLGVSDTTLRRIITVDQLGSRVLTRNTRSNDKITLSVIGKQMTISCNSKYALSYCWLQHHNGSTYTPGPKSEDSLFWYSGTGLEVGDCSITFREGRAEDSGIWTCHMGLMSPGIEVTDYAEVRVGGSITAVDTKISVKKDGSATVECVTANSQDALTYCRFTMPNETGFNIDENITPEKAIYGLYYFKKGASLNRGDCAVTIKKVSLDHNGRWICAGMIDKEKFENKDYVYLEVIDEKLSAASVTGIAFGFIIVVVGFAGFAYTTWRRRRSSQPSRQIEITQEIEMSPQGSEPISHFRLSDTSDSSATALTTGPKIAMETSYGTPGTSSTPI